MITSLSSTRFVLGKGLHARQPAPGDPPIRHARTLTDTNLVPALIADVGEPAAWRYIEFFAARIRNPNTRRAYARACGQFFAWCEERGLMLATVRPFDVAKCVEALQEKHGAPAVKQQLAAVRMLFD
jgi:hypothetical protein